MKKFLFIMIISLCFIIQGKVFAQRESGNVWASPMISISSLNGGNDVIDYYGMEANVINSFAWGFDLGYDFNKMYMFISIEEEGSTSLDKNNSTLKIKTTNASLNFAYPLWQTKSQKFSLDFRLGVGLYNTEIDYAKETNNIKPLHESVEQNYNLFLPVGLTLNLFKTNKTIVRLSCFYRHSFDTGTTKYFGSDKKDSNYPFNELGSLSLNLGCAFGI